MTISKKTFSAFVLSVLALVATALNAQAASPKIVPVSLAAQQSAPVVKPSKVIPVDLGQHTAPSARYQPVATPVSLGQPSGPALLPKNALVAHK